MQEGIRFHYGEFAVADDDGFVDFHIRVSPPNSVRRWLRPQVLFYCDEVIPFKPLPLGQAFPLLEWGMNWCVSNFDNQHFVIHAAVIEKSGKAVVMPAPPGSGKSTLCAGLINRGWRLLSDELTLISRHNGTISPLARPVSLKNESIDVIRQFAPGAAIGARSRDTAKGTVAHMRPPDDSVRNADIFAVPSWIVFPKYQLDSPARLEEFPKGLAFTEIANNSFNYGILGIEGFHLLESLVDTCKCYHFTYSSLDDAVEIFDAL